MRGAAIKAKRDTLVQKLMRWMNRHRLAVLNIVLYTVLFSLAIVSWSVYQQQKAGMEAQLQGQRMSQFHGITRVTLLGLHLVHGNDIRVL